MSLRAMPDHFVCDACQERQLLDALCGDASRGDWLACVRCCGCDLHRFDDPGGVAVFAPRAGKLTWRGLGPDARPLAPHDRKASPPPSSA